jgi:hypothetical protein
MTCERIRQVQVRVDGCVREPHALCSNTAFNNNFVRIHTQQLFQHASSLGYGGIGTRANEGPPQPRDLSYSVTYSVKSTDLGKERGCHTPTISSHHGHETQTCMPMRGDGCFVLGDHSLVALTKNESTALVLSSHTHAIIHYHWQLF